MQFVSFRTERRSISEVISLQNRKPFSGTQLDTRQSWYEGDMNAQAADATHLKPKIQCFWLNLVIDFLHPPLWLTWNNCP